MATFWLANRSSFPVEVYLKAAIQTTAFGIWYLFVPKCCWAIVIIVAFLDAGA